MSSVLHFHQAMCFIYSSVLSKLAPNVSMDMCQAHRPPAAAQASPDWGRPPAVTLRNSASLASAAMLNMHVHTHTDIAHMPQPHTRSTLTTRALHQQS